MSGLTSLTGAGRKGLRGARPYWLVSSNGKR